MISNSNSFAVEDEDGRLVASFPWLFRHVCPQTQA